MRGTLVNRSCFRTGDLEGERGKELKSKNFDGDAPAEGEMGGTDIARFREGVSGGLGLGKTDVLGAIVAKSKGPGSDWAVDKS